MWKIAVFTVVSAGLIYISRASLRVPRSHGFYRFFAWECILALFLLKVDVWFSDPFSLHQLISWFLLALSIITVTLGIQSLSAQGRQVKHRMEDSHLLDFEKTTALITTGIYHYIRHPLYSSLLLLAWGIFTKAPDWAGVLLALASTLFLVTTAKADEAECIQFFGQSYQAYMKHTKMFVPFLF